MPQKCVYFCLQSFVLAQLGCKEMFQTFVQMVRNIFLNEPWQGISVSTAMQRSRAGFTSYHNSDVISYFVYNVSIQLLTQKKPSQPCCFLPITQSVVFPFKEIKE